MESDQSTFDAEIVDKLASKLSDLYPFSTVDSLRYRSDAIRILLMLYDEGVLLKERP